MVNFPYWNLRTWFVDHWLIAIRTPQDTHCWLLTSVSPRRNSSFIQVNFRLFPLDTISTESIIQSSILSYTLCHKQSSPLLASTITIPADCQLNFMLPADKEFTPQLGCFNQLVKNQTRCHRPCIVHCEIVPVFPVITPIKWIITHSPKRFEHKIKKHQFYQSCRSLSRKRRFYGRYFIFSVDNKFGEWRQPIDFDVRFHWCSRLENFNYTFRNGSKGIG